VNEALQGILIVAFSVLLIPTGLHALGGWSQLAHHVPASMLNLFAEDGGSPLFIFSVLLAGLVQLHGLKPDPSDLQDILRQRAGSRPYFQQLCKRMFHERCHDLTGNIFVPEKMLAQRFFEGVHKNSFKSQATELATSLKLQAASEII